MSQTVYYLLAEDREWHPETGKLESTGDWRPDINGKARSYGTLSKARQGRQYHGDYYRNTKFRILAVTFDGDNVTAEWIDE